MHRSRSVVGILALALAATLAFLPGCGGDEKTGTIEVSPEAQKADDLGQKGMMDYMQSKQAKK